MGTLIESNSFLLDQSIVTTSYYVFQSVTCLEKHSILRVSLIILATSSRELLVKVTNFQEFALTIPKHAASSLTV